MNRRSLGLVAATACAIVVAYVASHSSRMPGPTTAQLASGACGAPPAPTFFAGAALASPARWSAVGMSFGHHVHGDANGWTYSGNGRAAPSSFAASADFDVQPGRWIVTSAWVDARAVGNGSVIAVHAFSDATGIVAAAYAPPGFTGRLCSAPYQIPPGVRTMHIGPNMNGATARAGGRVTFAEFAISYVPGP